MWYQDGALESTFQRSSVLYKMKYLSWSLEPRLQWLMVFMDTFVIIMTKRNGGVKFVSVSQDSLINTLRHRASARTGDGAQQPGSSSSLRCARASIGGSAASAQPLRTELISQSVKCLRKSHIVRTLWRCSQNTPPVQGSTPSREGAKIKDLNRHVFTRQLTLLIFFIIESFAFGWNILSHVKMCWIVTKPTY